MDLLPNLRAPVSWRFQEERRKPAGLGEGPSSHGNRAKYIYLQSSPEGCVALAKGQLLPLRLEFIIPALHPVF